MAGWTPPAGSTTRWLLACMAGLGIGLPLATLWDLSVMRDLLLPPAWRVGMATVALRAVGGAITGFCLGVAQAWALRHTYPSLPPLRWVGATAAAGFLAALASMAAWGLLMLQYEERPMLAFLLAGPLVSGLCGGLLYGLAQGFVLDGVVVARSRWVWLVTLGWVAASALFSLQWVLGVAGMLTLAASAVVGGVIEGLALGLVTVGAFRFMPPRPVP